MTDGWKQVWEDLLNSLKVARSGEEVRSAAKDDLKVSLEEQVEAAEGTHIASVKSDFQTPSERTVLASEPPSRITPAEEEPSLDSIFPAESTLYPRPAVSLLQFLGENPWRVASYLAVGFVVIASFWLLVGSQLLKRWIGPNPPAPDVIASFDGGELTISDLEAHLELLAPEEFLYIVRSPETLLLVAEDLITDELVRGWAAERRPDADENFRHSMQHITEKLNLETFEGQLHEGAIPVSESEIQAYYSANKSQFGDQPLSSVREQIRQLLVAENEGEYIQDYIQRLRDNASITRNLELLDVPAPSDEDLRNYYEANLEQFKLPRQAKVTELRFLLNDDETTARQNADNALLKIRSGMSFEEVSQVISEALLTKGGTIPEGQREPEWDAVVFFLTEGETSSVFRAGDAFSIVRLDELLQARTRSLEEVRSLVLAAVEGQVTARWFEDNASKTLFTLKGRQYSLGQFYREYRELPLLIQTDFTGSEGMKILAELLVERLLLVEDTYDQLLDVQNQPLVDEARLQILKQMMEQEDVDDRIEITDEEMQQFYEQNKALMVLPPKARIRYIQIGLGTGEDEARRALERADEAYRKLVPGLFQSGAEFASVAQEYSEDPETAANGGEFPGWVGESEDILAEIGLHPFHEAILPLQPGDISRPFQFGDSLYIVQVIERSEPETLDFEVAKPYIEEILTQQKHDELAAQLQESLLKQTDLVIYRGVLEEYIETLSTQTQHLATPSPQ